ncbi:MAG: MerC family mercury resistance protein [Candidatus Rokubacteria bacterium]|nr:MerC family mercury resistance protein [Candidatus Rokubacteria bacterium]
MLGAINKLGVLGTAVSSALSLGCCAPQVLGPLAAVVYAGGLLDRVPGAWQLPLLYGSLAVALLGFGLGWRRHRGLAPVLLFLPGAAAVLYPLHAALDVSVLKVLIWLGFSLLLAATAWDTWLRFRGRRCGFGVSQSEASQ